MNDDAVIEAMAKAIEEAMDHGMWTYEGAAIAALAAYKKAQWQQLFTQINELPGLLMPPEEISHD